MTLQQRKNIATPKIKSIAIASIMVLAMIVPTISISAKADPQQALNAAQLSSMFPEHMPVSARQMQLSVNDQVAQHEGWIAHMSWNATGATIMYLGPYASDPYRVSNINEAIGHPFAPQKSTTASISPLTLFEGLKEGDAISKSCTSSSTAEFSESVKFNIKKSTVSQVDNYQIVNAMSSDNSRWLQAGTAFFNTSDLKWHAGFNSWKISTAVNEFATTPPITLSDGNPVQASVQDDPFNAGQYVLGISQQVSPFNSVSTTIHPTGDTGFKINLGQVTNSFNQPFPSAGMVEQKTTSSGTGYNFGTENFNTYTLTDSFGGTVTQCVNGWIGQVGSGAHVSSTSNNPAQDTFAFG